MMSSAPKDLQLNTTLRRDRRTLIWLQQQSTSITWSRWNGIVSSLADYKRWYDLDARIVGVVALHVEDDVDTFLDNLYTIAKDVQMVFISRAILSLKKEDYWLDNFDNLLCLDDAMEQYPFLIHPWNGTVEDAITICAILCRYSRLVDVKEQPRISLFQTHLTSVHKIVPPQSWLITQYFVHSDKTRAKEIRECLRKNCECSYIDVIILLTEKNLSHEWANMPGSKKIKQIVIGKRLTYFDVLTYISSSVPNNVITILSNADIYFDETLLEIWKVNLADRLFALLRWDDTADGKEPQLFGPCSDSQDTWIMLSDSVKSRTWDKSVFGFQLGQAGCDNAFAGHMLQQRFLLCNPALSIKTYHLHNSGIRNYTKKDAIYAKVYVLIIPSHLLHTIQEQVPRTSPWSICNELVSFDVQSSSLSNEITYCTMLEKEGRYKWEPSVENHYFEPAIPVYSWKNAAVTPNGLVYDSYTLYTGKYENDPRFNYWNGSTVDIFTPLHTQKRMLAIPFADLSIFSHPDTYILQYVSRAARLLESYPNSSIWIPNGYECYLNALQHNKEPLQGLTLDENSGCWAEEVVGFLPGPVSCELGHEDIYALRERLPSWKSSPTRLNCIIVTNDVITPRFVYESITPWLKAQNTNWEIHIVSEKSPGVYDSIVGATLCILLGGPNTHNRWSKLWALPRGCCVIEFQQELMIDGEFQHLCHISDLKSWILLLAKGSNDDVQAQIMEQLTKWNRKYSSEIVVPVI
jgi:hypothetical protein